MTYALRRPTPEDIPKIVDLHIHCWKETYGDLLPEGFFTQEYVRERHRLWERLLADQRPELKLCIAEDEAALIGFATAGPTLVLPGGGRPRDLQLYSLYVPGVRHGTGVGQELLDAVLDAHPAMLFVAEDNPRAVAFYRRNGFEPDGTGYVDESVPSLSLIRMVR